MLIHPLVLAAANSAAMVRSGVVRSAVVATSAGVGLCVVTSADVVMAVAAEQKMKEVTCDIFPCFINKNNVIHHTDLSF